MRTTLLVLAGPLLLAGCGTMRSGRRWGEDATLLPGWSRLGHAASDAATDPWTWAPLAGAGVVAIGGWDDNISNWARDHTPIFGSTTGAEDASKTLHDYSGVAWMASLVATPSGDDPLGWTGNKLKGFAVEWSANQLTNWSTQALKDAFPRNRPDGSGFGSFPSSGASETQSYATLARLNLDSIDMTNNLRLPLQIGLQGMAVGEAWARIEAGKHHPTDVMVGMALGNFVARFVHDGFLGLPDDVAVNAFVDPAGGGYGLAVSFRF